MKMKIWKQTQNDNANKNKKQNNHRKQNKTLTGKGIQQIETQKKQ